MPVPMWALIDVAHPPVCPLCLSLTVPAIERAVRANLPTWTEIRTAYDGTVHSATVHAALGAIVRGPQQ